MKEHAVGQPSDLFHFQAHAYRWQEKHLCNSGGDARLFFIQQNNHFRTGGRVRRLSRPNVWARLNLRLAPTKILTGCSLYAASRPWNTSLIAARR
jgi:hypothetical protein